MPTVFSELRSSAAMDYRHLWCPAVHILRIIFTLQGLLVPVNNAEFNLPLQAIGRMAETFGQTIYDFSSEVTALTDLRSDYLLMDVEIRPIDGQKVARDVKHALQKLLVRKVDAIQNLEKLAELFNRRHRFDPNIEIMYHESKKLNVSEFELVRHEHFNNISVNLTMSTVHIPTSIYDQSAEVLNGIAWTTNLDEMFQKNFDEDPSLTWQYFCSSTGFFRLYPGTVWHRDRSSFIKPDVFDCRLRKWYIDAVSTSKDVIILLDSSLSMKGQNFEIAKEMTRLIIDTLTDNDYFNVITFSNVPDYLESCSNMTLVHANTANKRRMTSALDRLEAAGTASHELALVEAFELLSVMNLTSRGSLCHRTVLLLTSGIQETFDEVFSKYNSPAMVRVFTYLVGNGNAVHSANMKVVACNNKGYFTHIRSPVGIHRHLHNFISVLSRPLVLTRPDRTTWTSVYEDTVGLDLVLTVSRPVFNDGRLLGVIGTDVKLSEIEDIFKQFQLGVNAYAFIVTHNGYVVSHPELRPKYKNALNPNHDVVSLDKLEQSPVVSTLLERMLNRESGHIRLNSYQMYDNMKRLRPKENNYFYTDISNTPFSLALSLPYPYGGNWTESKLQLRDFDVSALKASDAVIAPWNYCKFRLSEQNQKPLEMLMKYLDNGKIGRSVYKELCNEELVSSILFDAEATRGAYSSWMKENLDDSASDLGSLKKSGVEQVFIGTKGGLTRYLSLVQTLTDPDFIENHRSTIDALYYKRAVDNGEEIFTFSVPFDAGKTSDLEKVMVTASTPIFINKDGRESVVAVVGLQMNYKKFLEFFMNNSKFCAMNEEHCKMCSREEIDCYLLDFNGYVVLSEDQKELGQFYGELDGSASILMKELTMNDSTTQPSMRKGVFRRIQNNDYQGVCEILRKTNSGSHSSFINPFKLLFESFLWLINEFFLFLVTLNFGIFHVSDVSASEQANVSGLWDFESETVAYPGGEGIDSVGFDAIIGTLMKIASVDQVYKWKDECIRKTPDGDLAFMCLKDILKLYEPGVTGYKPCIKSYTHYVANLTQLPQAGLLFTCDVCTKSFSINLVPRTNLMLLAVDSLCYCNSEPAMTTKPVEINYNDSTACQMVEEETLRRRPDSCYAHHQKEDPMDCGSASLLYPSLVTLLHALSLSIISVC